MDQGKWSYPGKGVVPSPTLQCSRYWKGSLRVAFDHSQIIYIYLEVNKEINPTVWRKLKKQNNPKFDQLIMKVDIEFFSYNNLLHDFKFMKNIVKILMDIWWNNRRKESVDKKKAS